MPVKQRITAQVLIPTAHHLPLKKLHFSIFIIYLDYEKDLILIFRGPDDEEMNTADKKMTKAQRDKNIVAVWNFLLLVFIFVAIFFKPEWINSAIIGFMVTLGLNLGTYHKYHRDKKA